MQTLGPQLLSALMHYGGDLASRLQRSNQSKQAVTDRARKNHFLRWCESVGVEAGGTTNPSLQARNFIIACYAVALTRGQTLLGKRIRHSTLKSYIKQAINCHTNRKLPSPALADTNYIKTITDAVKKYEQVPNRREMIHDAMFIFLVKLYKQHRKSSPDGLITALCEWFSWVVTLAFAALNGATIAPLPTNASRTTSGAIALTRLPLSYKISHLNRSTAHRSGNTNKLVWPPLHFAPPQYSLYHVRDQKAKE